ncbi:MAG: TadE/TadG family type IV pilus assembly protein [Sutterellaceae bacterium]|nr:TadE/TadG family type IV pilus assembly protein [Sutterellaceae bacterium]
MMSRLWSRFFKPLSDRRGAVVVETALLAPLFLLFVGVLLETARISIAYSVIDNALFLGTMQAKVERGVNAEALIRKKLEESENALFSAKDIELTITSSDSIKEISNGAGQTGGGRGNALVHVKAEMELSVLKGFLPKSMQAKRSIDFFYINEPDY